MHMLRTLILLMVLPIFLPCSGWSQEPVMAPEYIKEINTLKANGQVKLAFDRIEKEDAETVRDMIHLTEILAPPFGEGPKGQAFAELLRQAGADSVWTDPEGNVFGLRKGTATETGYVGLDAHLDVVFPEGTDVKVRYVGDTLKAPGIGDDTRGLAMVIRILNVMKETGIRTRKDLLFVGSVGEEGLGDLRGMKYIFNQSGLNIDSWIAIDGGEIGRISNAGLGSKRYKVIIRGPGGHSWGAFGLANPHHALGKVIDQFSTAAWDFTSGDISKTSFNVGRIGGGTSVNSIPFESWMEVDMRALDPENLAEVEKILKTTVQQAIDEYNASGVKGKVEYGLEPIGDRPSGELPSSLPLIQRTMAATASFGETPVLGRGSTNINIPVSLGIPSVCIGRGGKGGGAHSLHEWYLNEDGAKAIQLALLIALAQAGFEN